MGFPRCAILTFTAPYLGWLLTSAKDWKQWVNDGTKMSVYLIIASDDNYLIFDFSM